MNGELLLDTNAVMGLFADDAALRDHVAQSSRILVAAVVLGELYYGARKSTRVEENMRRLSRLLAEAVVVPSDAATAHMYGIIRNELRLKGRPIPENDLWLAAVARQHDVVLVSRDSHFTHVDGLRLVSW